jgi:hypothetical protein
MRILPLCHQPLTVLCMHPFRIDAVRPTIRAPRHPQCRAHLASCSGFLPISGSGVEPKTRFLLALDLHTSERSIDGNASHGQMFDSIRSSWTRLKEGQPGRRFCALYEHRARERQKQSAFRRNAAAALGVLLVLAGLAIGWLPGPGGFIAVLGLGLLATRFRFLARALDASEVRLLAVWGHAWTRRSAAGRTLVVLGAAVVAAGVLYAAAHWLRS